MDVGGVCYLMPDLCGRSMKSVTTTGRRIGGFSARLPDCSKRRGGGRWSDEDKHIAEMMMGMGFSHPEVGSVVGRSAGTTACNLSRKHLARHRMWSALTGTMATAGRGLRTNRRSSRCSFTGGGRRPGSPSCSSAPPHPSRRSAAASASSEEVPLEAEAEQQAAQAYVLRERVLERVDRQPHLLALQGNGALSPRILKI